MARTGHVSGRWNNYFHLPILSGLPVLPQFADDVFIQSLTGYASGFWQGFAGHVPLEWAPAFLLGWAITSRFLSMLALLACADLVGIRSLRERLCFVTLIAFSALLLSHVPAGGGGLFINYFTHSELANAPLLFTIWLTARRRYGWAVAMNGITCFLNAFMAVWALAPMLAIALYQRSRGEVGWRTILSRGALGLPLFALLAIPAVRALLSYAQASHATTFDHVDFLVEYAPIHSLIWAQKIPSLIKLALVTATGVSAASLLVRENDDAAPILAGLAGFCVLWIAGAVLSLVTSSSALLNLHLLRSSIGIHLLAGLSLAALSVTWLRDDGPRRRLWAPLMVLGASLRSFLLPIALTAMLLHRRATVRRWRLDWLVLIVLAVLWPVQILLQARFNAAASAQVQQWRALGDWARTHSRSEDLFLLPISTAINDIGSMRASRDQVELEAGAEVFQTAAERRVWVDFRSGAAVMWWPSYYPMWKSRITEVLALRSHDDRLAYARTRGIAYLIDRCGGRGKAVFAVGQRCVYRIETGQSRQLSSP